MQIQPCSSKEEHSKLSEKNAITKQTERRISILLKMVYVAAWWKYKPQKYLVVKAGWVALYSVVALSRDGVSSH